MKKTVIIAEAGVNHNGQLKLAKQLINAAVEAKVDFVKFQTFKAEQLVLKRAKKAEYQIRNTQNNDSQFSMLKKLELSEQDHRELIAYCKEKNIGFLSSAFTVDSQKYLDNLKLPLVKIPSGEITNYPYLKHIATSKTPVYLSTGMSTLEEVGAAIKVLCSGERTKQDITLLQCNTEYPTPYNDVNLNAMLTLKEKFKVNVGYSDHTLGVEIPIAAVALGATVIEKHFTLDKTMQGPDHLASLSPEELKQMVLSIRNTEAALSGNGEKKPSNSELKNIAIARKSICITQSIAKGERIQPYHLDSLRPGNGISPMNWEVILDKKVNKDLEKGHQLDWDDIEA